MEVAGLTKGRAQKEEIREARTQTGKSPHRRQEARSRKKKVRHRRGLDSNYVPKPRDKTVLQRGTSQHKMLWRERGRRGPKSQHSYALYPGSRIIAWSTSQCGFGLVVYFRGFLIPLGHRALLPLSWWPALSQGRYDTVECREQESYHGFRVQRV